MRNAPSERTWVLVRIQYVDFSDGSNWIVMLQHLHIRTEFIYGDDRFCVHYVYCGNESQISLQLAERIYYAVHVHCHWIVRCVIKLCWQNMPKSKLERNVEYKMKHFKAFTSIRFRCCLSFLVQTKIHSFAVTCKLPKNKDHKKLKV